MQRCEAVCDYCTIFNVNFSLINKYIHFKILIIIIDDYLKPDADHTLCSTTL